MVGMDSNFLCEQAVLGNLLRKLLHLVLVNIYSNTSFTVFKKIKKDIVWLERESNLPESHTCKAVVPNLPNAATP